MLQIERGNILDARAEALVNTVNCVGVMGRGIALQFKEAYPANFKAYAAACQRGEVQPGRMFVFDTGELTMPRYIINFPTKRHWRGKSRLEDIESGLGALVREIRARRIQSVAIPPLGSGLGGLKWEDVLPLIRESITELADVEVSVFAPDADSPDRRPNRSTNVPRMTIGRASLVTLMHRYLAALMDPSITLLEVHKLMYFLQVAGEPLRLRYVKAAYGPYAENLRHVLKDIEGHLITGYVSGGDSPTMPLALVPGAVRDAEAALAAHEPTSKRAGRVARLVEGFETPFGLELLATVHWVIAEEDAANDDDVERLTYEWSGRKRQFKPAQIRLAAGRLRAEGWVD